MSDKPIRVQLSRKKGWKMPPNTVKVDRSTGYGNPFVAGEFPSLSFAWFHDRRVETADEAVALFRKLLLLEAGRRDDTVDQLVKLRGKNLACWCAIVDKNGKYNPCHADVLLSLANQMACEEVRDENLRRAKR